MNKSISFTIFILFLSAIINLSASENRSSQSLIKRKVAILPITNASQIDEYSYLSTSIMDSLKASLVKTDSFIIIEESVVKNQLSAKNIDTFDFIWNDAAIEIGESIQADVVLFGFFVISDEQITINLNALDTMAKKSAVNVQNKGGIGIEIYENVKNISNQMVIEMTQKLAPYKKSDFINYKALSISFMTSGASSLAISIPFLVVCPIYYLYIPETTTYSPAIRELYLNYYYLIMSGIIAGSIFAGVGVIFMIISIPFFIIDYNKKKKNNVSLYMNYKNQAYSLGFSIRI